MDDRGISEALRKELARLALRVEDLPAGGIAGDRAALENWLEHLRTLLGVGNSLATR